MISKIFLFISALTNIMLVNSFMYYNTCPIYKNLNMRFLGDISRRNILELIPSTIAPIIIHPKYVLAYKDKIYNSDDKINKVAVFGASGYTGGDTIRTLLNKNINVLAITRRNVEIVGRDNAKINSLVIDNIKDKNKIKKVSGVDILKPETFEGILYGCDAVIFCAASRPSVKVTGTPGTDAYEKMKNITQDAIAEPSSNVEDIGLVNVAKEAIKSKVKRLIIVSSICAKCQIGKENYGETIDRGFSSCDACYKKQTGEERVRILYKNIPNNFKYNLSYTIIRPGMLSPGEKRGYKEVEFNQGVSKSGIISRIDLADILVSAAETDSSARKTFEVYYKDTAQPVDMFKSLKTCKEMGKSVKECFFGEGYNDTSILSIDKMLNTTIKGTIFPSGKEIYGEVYSKMFKYLKEDVYEDYDINTLMSKDII